MTQKREGKYKGYTEGEPIGFDFNLLPQEVRQLLDETGVCLNCGRVLKHNITVDTAHSKQRENRGYCCFKCMVNNPPKVAYLERLHNKPMLNILLDTLNETKNVSITAQLLGYSLPHMYKLFDKYHIKRFTMWGVSQYEKTNQKYIIEQELNGKGCTKEVLGQDN